MSQSEAQMVAHAPLMYTSGRPACGYLVDPLSINRTSYSVNFRQNRHVINVPIQESKEAVKYYLVFYIIAILKVGSCSLFSKCKSGFKG